MINKSSILNGSKYFSSGLFQNYFVFIPAKEYIKYFSGNIHINSLKSDSLIAPTFADHYILPNHWLDFNENCLINYHISITTKVTSYGLTRLIVVQSLQALQKSSFN